MLGSYSVNGGSGAWVTDDDRPYGGAYGSFTYGMTNMATAGRSGAASGGGGDYLTGEGNSCYGTNYGKGGVGGSLSSSSESGQPGAIIIEYLLEPETSGVFDQNNNLISRWENLGLIRDNPFNGEENRNIIMPLNNGGNVTLVFPRNRITYVGTYMFQSCTNLTNVVITDGVKGIGSYAFQYCNGLKYIEIPDSVSFINSYAFYIPSTSLDIVYNGTKAQWDAINKSENWNNTTETKLHCTDYEGAA